MPHYFSVIYDDPFQARAGSFSWQGILAKTGVDLGRHLTFVSQVTASNSLFIFNNMVFTSFYKLKGGVKTPILCSSQSGPF